MKVKLPHRISDQDRAKLIAAQGQLRTTLKHPGVIEKRINELSAKRSEVDADIIRLEPMVDGTDDELVMKLTARRVQTQLLAQTIETTKEKMLAEMWNEGNAAVRAAIKLARTIVSPAVAILEDTLTGMLEPHFPEAGFARQAARNLPSYQIVALYLRENPPNIDNHNVLLSLAQEYLAILDGLLAGEILATNDLVFHREEMVRAQKRTELEEAIEDTRRRLEEAKSGSAAA